MLFEIKFTTRISGLAKIAYETHYVYVEAPSAKEAEAAFQEGVKVREFGFVGILNRELGKWYKPRFTTLGLRKPPVRFGPVFDIAPRTTTELREEFAKYEVDRAAYRATLPA